MKDNKWHGSEILRIPLLSLAKNCSNYYKRLIFCLWEGCGTNCLLWFKLKKWSPILVVLLLYSMKRFAIRQSPWQEMIPAFFPFKSMERHCSQSLSMRSATVIFPQLLLSSASNWLQICRMSFSAIFPISLSL